MHRALGYPIGLVQVARGGSALCEWHVEENAGAPLWHNMLHCLRLAGGKIEVNERIVCRHEGAVLGDRLSVLRRGQRLGGPCFRESSGNVVQREGLHVVAVFPAANVQCECPFDVHGGLSREYVRDAPVDCLSG